jgi:hypothetical protein
MRIRISEKARAILADPDSREELFRAVWSKKAGRLVHQGGKTYRVILPSDPPADLKRPTEKPAIP